MVVFTLAQNKGGVGKSTLATNLACAAIEEGFRCAIVELDRQGTASNWAERRINNVPEVWRTTGVELKKSLSDANDNLYDIIFIDLPGAHNLSAVWAIRASDFVIIPSRPSVADLEASVATVTAVADEKRANAFVLTFASATDHDTKNARKKLKDAGINVAPKSVRFHNHFPQAVEKGQWVAELAPKAASTKDIIKLWEWLKGQVDWSRTK